MGQSDTKEVGRRPMDEVHVEVVLELRCVKNAVRRLVDDSYRALGALKNRGCRGVYGG